MTMSISHSPCRPAPFFAVSQAVDCRRPQLLFSVAQLEPVRVTLAMDASAPLELKARVVVSAKHQGELIQEEIVDRKRADEEPVLSVHGEQAVAVQLSDPVSL